MCPFGREASGGYGSGEAGGGGSYLSPSFTNTELVAGANSGDGLVTITLSATVPEPSSIILLALGALGLAVHAWRCR